MLPPGSFISHPIPVPAALRQEVHTDTVLRTRLRNALRLPSDAAVERLAGTLSIKTLSEPHVMKVYYARKEGAWGYKVRRVPAGTLVYADPAGVPRLLRICGNPVETMSPAKISRPDRIAQYSTHEGDAGMVVEQSDSSLIPFSGNMLATPQTSTVAKWAAPDGLGTGGQMLTAEAGDMDEPALYDGALPVPATAATPTASGTGFNPPSLAPAAGLLPIAFYHSPSAAAIKSTSAPEPPSALLAGGVFAAMAAFRCVRARRKALGKSVAAGR